MSAKPPLEMPPINCFTAPTIAERDAGHLASQNAMSFQSETKFKWAGLKEIWRTNMACHNR